jgi:ABC-type antimicrobial peptide transport system permease subunit
VAGDNPHHTGLRAASSDYFDVLGVPILEGRIFDSRPRSEVVVNQTFARRFLAADGRPATRHRVTIDKSGKWYDVVGVVADLPENPGRPTPTPEIFMLYSNNYWPLLNFALRTTTPARILAPLIREEVSRLDSTVIVKSVMPLEDKLRESTAVSGVRSGLVGTAAMLALLLMAIGIHGLIAGDVTARWREFGVRLALGATVPTIRMLLIRKIGALASIGLVAGIAAVLLTTRLLTSSFAGLPPVRVQTFVAVSSVIGLAAFTAILWPLYRIGRVDPATALRHE